MRFTNGYWLAKDGVEPHFASQAFEVEERGGELVVYAPDKPVLNRGDTLNRMLLTIRYSSPMRNVIRVR
ncbi:MAG: hypothetical protein LBK61_02565, partial [Spirochaetaceae bacterium]|nr:hypothetical protein [Spirochaetaceae bacterium]